MEHSFAGTWSWYRQVTTRSSDGSQLKFERYGNGPVNAWLILPKALEGAFRNKMPIYRVDENPVRSVLKGKETETKEDRWIRWHIDPGTQSPGPLLKEFMEGRLVVFQYYLFDSLIRETSFDLEGCGKALTQLLQRVE